MAGHPTLIARIGKAAALCGLVAACQTGSGNQPDPSADISNAQAAREAQIVKSLEDGLPLKVVDQLRISKGIDHPFERTSRSWLGDTCAIWEDTIIRLESDDLKGKIEKRCSYTGFEDHLHITNINIERDSHHHPGEIAKFTFAGIRQVVPGSEINFESSIRVAAIEAVRTYVPGMVQEISSLRSEPWGKGAGFISSFEAVVKENETASSLTMTCNLAVGVISHTGRRVLNSSAQAHFSAMTCATKDSEPGPGVSLEESWQLLERVRLGGR